MASLLCTLTYGDRTVSRGVCSSARLVQIGEKKGPSAPNARVRNGCRAKSPFPGPSPLVLLKETTVHAEAGFQLLELSGEAIAGGMDVLGLGDELHFIVAADTPLGKGLLELIQPGAVDDQQLVLVELNFLRDARVEHGHAGAAVVQQQVLVFPEDALEDRQVDVFSVKVLVSLAGAVMAGVEPHVDDVSQRVQQVEKDVEEVLAG